MVDHFSVQFNRLGNKAKACQLGVGLGTHSALFSAKQENGVNPAARGYRVPQAQTSCRLYRIDRIPKKMGT